MPKSKHEQPTREGESSNYAPSVASMYNVGVVASS